MIGNLGVTTWKVITQKRLFYEKDDPDRNVKQRFAVYFCI
jgi:hypothetical protein